MKEKDQSFFVTELAVGPSRPVHSSPSVQSSSSAQLFLSELVKVESGEWRCSVADDARTYCIIIPFISIINIIIIIVDRQSSTTACVSSKGYTSNPIVPSYTPFQWRAVPPVHSPNPSPSPIAVPIFICYPTCGTSSQHLATVPTVPITYGTFLLRHAPSTVPPFPPTTVTFPPTYGTYLQLFASLQLHLLPSLFAPTMYRSVRFYCTFALSFPPTVPIGTFASTVPTHLRYLHIFASTVTFPPIFPQIFSLTSRSRGRCQF